MSTSAELHRPQLRVNASVYVERVEGVQQLDAVIELSSFEVPRLV
jgi:hypothetical protein